MKVAHFIHSINKEAGGTTVYMQLLAEALSNKYDIVVVTNIPINPAIISNVRICTLNLSLKRILVFKREFRNFLLEEKPDILHVNGIWTIQNAMIQSVAESLNIPVIITPHGMLEPWIMARNSWKKKIALFLYQKRALKNAICIHTTADMELENLKKFNYLNTFAFIPNGINSKNIKPKETLIRQKKILFLSRVHPKKGIELLIDAFAKVNLKINDWEVIIAGDGELDYIETLQKKTIDLHINEKVSFVGPIYGENKFDLFRDARIFVLPTYCENFGYVVAEAMATGTPVITTKGAPWSILEETNSGCWIDIGVEPLTVALEKLMLKDADALLKMGENGRKLIEEKYSTEIFGQQFTELYEWIMKKSNKPHFIFKT